MGIREVMVDRRRQERRRRRRAARRRLALRARPDLPLPARRARHRPRHRPGPRLRRRRAVLLRPRRQHPAGAGARPVADEFAAGPWGAGTLLYRVAGPGAVRRRRARRRPATSSASRRSPRRPRATSSRSASTSCGRTRSRSSSASPRPGAASSRSPTCSTTTSPAAACSPGSSTATGPTPAPCRASCGRPSWPPRTTAAGRLPDPPQRPGRRLVSADSAGGSVGRARRAAPRHRRGRVHRLVLRARDVLARRDGTRIAVLDKLTYAGNEANLRPVLDDPEQADRLTFVRGDIADRWPGRARSSPTPTRSSTSPPSRTSTGRSSIPRRSCGPGSSASTSCSRRVSRRPGQAGRSATSRSRPTRSTARSRRAARSRRIALAPRSPYAAAKAAGELLVRSLRRDPRARRRRHPRLEHVRPVPPPREADPAVRHERPRRPAAAALRRRAPGPRLAATSPTTRPGSSTSSGTASSGETYNLPGGTELPNREVVRRILERLGKPWSLVRAGGRPAGSRPTLRDGRLEDRRARLAAAASPSTRGWPRPIDWFVANEAWWRAIKAGDWDAYYERQYGDAAGRVAAPPVVERPTAEAG